MISKHISVPIMYQSPYIVRTTEQCHYEGEIKKHNTINKMFTPKEWFDEMVSQKTINQHTKPEKHCSTEL